MGLVLKLCIYFIYIDEATTENGNFFIVRISMRATGVGIQCPVPIIQ